MQPRHDMLHVPFEAKYCKGAALLSSLSSCSFDNSSRPMQRQHISKQGWQLWHNGPECCKTCLLLQVVVETTGGDKYRGTAEDIKRLLSDLDLKQQVSAVLALFGSLRCTR